MDGEGSDSVQYGEFDMYWYTGNDPVNRVDPTGLATVNGFCCGKKQEVQDQVDKVCNVLANHITVRSLNKCVKDRCDNGSVTCADCWPFSSTGLTVMSLFSQSGEPKAYICTNSNSTVRGAGHIAVHEFAHTCGWSHPWPWNQPDGSGVPGPEGGGPGAATPADCSASNPCPKICEDCQWSI